MSRIGSVDHRDDTLTTDDIEALCESVDEDVVGVLDYTVDDPALEAELVDALLPLLGVPGGR